jgi:hypothetical protein
MLFIWILYLGFIIFYITPRRRTYLITGNVGGFFYRLPNGSASGHTHLMTSSMAISDLGFQHDKRKKIDYTKYSETRLITWDTRQTPGTWARLNQSGTLIQS